MEVILDRFASSSTTSDRSVLDLNFISRTQLNQSLYYHLLLLNGIIPGNALGICTASIILRMRIRSRTSIYKSVSSIYLAALQPF